MNYYLRRFLRVIVTIWAVATFTFALIRLLPGGPLVQLRAQLIRSGASPERVETLIQSYTKIQPDAPIYVQYFDYITSLVQGDLGESISTGRSVGEVVGGALPWTLWIAIATTILVFALAIVWGAIMAYFEGSNFDLASSSASILAASMPFYVLAMLLIIIVGYEFGWFPTRFRIDPNLEAPVFSVAFVGSALYHSVLPIASMVLTGAGLQVLAMRGNSISVLGKDFVTVARLRGLSDRRISITYVARNAILPMYTSMLLSVGWYLGGTVIVEEIFTYRGIGYYMYEGLESRDYPLMMGIFLILTSTLVIGVFVADLTYGLVDPRIQTGDQSESF
ncbi:ABC transporter permease [Halorhabdus amylolytica]|uniref:ABC transporter permease n=1 Tax=Halorhabdus amylolytica TaxID=2559573 RepID=UPI0010AB3291|nr:ABC transporter permease [Halorhabdus amylolytica]